MSLRGITLLIIGLLITGLSENISAQEGSGRHEPAPPARATPAQDDPEPTPAPPAADEDEDLTSEEPAADGAAALQEGLELLARGKYPDAKKKLRAVAAKDGKNAVARGALVRVEFERGKLSEAEEAAEAGLQDLPDDPGLLTWLGRVEFARGKYADSLTFARRALRLDQDHPGAHLLEAQSLLETGALDEAEQRLDWFIGWYNGHPDLSSADLTFAARGIWLLATRKGDKDLAHEVADASNTVLDFAVSKDKANAEALVVWGQCYLEKYVFPAAKGCFEDALKINPNLGEAHLGLSIVTISSGDPRGMAQAVAGLARALTLNPALLEGYAFQAGQAMDDENYAEARTILDRGLQINPNSSLLRAPLAAIALIQDNDAAFRAECQKVLAVNPRCASLYLHIAEAVTRKLRFEDAQKYYELAVQTDPHAWDAFIALGMNYGRTGNHAKAREYLEKAFARDPFHLWTKNTLDLLDGLRDEFTPVETPHFRIYLNTKELPLLRHAVTSLHEEAWATMSKRYGFEPRVPVIAEMYPKHADFSVATAGMPGLGALGACFGPRVTLLSPKAKETMGVFNWGSVVWHELGHVFALQLSKGRVPRWFTEGLSTYEESLGRPDWGRELEHSIFQAYHTKQLPTVEQIAGGQAGPNQLLSLYEEGSLICRYIDEEYGFDAIVSMLKLWGEGKSTEQVFSGALERSLTDFSGDFSEWLKAWVAEIKARPPVDPRQEATLRTRIAGNPEDAAALGALARICVEKDLLSEAKDFASRAIEQDAKSIDGHVALAMVHYKNRRWERAGDEMRLAIEAGADEYGLHYRLGEILRRQGDLEGAIAEFQSAKACFARFVGSGKKEDNPYIQMAQIYEERGDTDRQIEQLSQYCAIDHDDVKRHLALAKLLRAKGEWEKVRELCRAVLFVEPKDILVHQYLTEAAFHLKDPAERRREAEATILLLEDVNKEGKADKFLADFHCEAAEACFDLGDRENALQHANAAFQFVPDSERANAILERMKK